MEKRVIYTSDSTLELMRFHKQKKLSVYSFFPVDKPGCICQAKIKEVKDTLAITHPKNRDDVKKSMGDSIECSRDKTGMKRFVITCANCNQLQGYLWAYDERLLDWCDFHYYQWTDGVQWKGCLTPNISPIDLKLTLECACGQDTRDFRPNQTLPGIVSQHIEEKNRIGRDFGESNSKFIVTEMEVISLKGKVLNG